MTDAEINAKVQEMEAEAFSKMRTMLNVANGSKDAVTHMGYKSIGEMLEDMMKGSIKKIDRFMADNLKDE